MIGLLIAAQLAIVVHAPDTASACAPIEISVAARAPGVIPPRIEPVAPSPGLQLLKTMTTTRTERDGRGATALTESTWIVATDALGRVAVPSFVASIGTEHATASAPPITVHASGPLPPTVLVRAWLDRSGRMGASDTLFVGQQVDYVVDVQLNEPARQRLRRNPTFFPPEMPGVLAYDLAPPSALARAGRRCFETLSYRRALFPLFAGRTAIAPAALTYSLPLSTSFFSREETFELRTDSVRFVALDVPAEGRPVDFAGAVGALAASARLSAPSARMGDPVVLTLRLEGSGNVKLWPRPPLALTWALVAPGSERVVVDTSKDRVRGAKEFDWLLTPRQDGKDSVPSIAYPYFDAERRAYGVASTTPLALDVAKAALASIDSAPQSRFAIRRTLRDEVPPPVPTRPWFWLVLAIAPIPAAVRNLRERSHRKVERRSATRRLKQAASRHEPLTSRDVRRLFLTAVGERVPSTIGLTQRGAFARALRRSGVTVETADVAAELLERLDSAAFSSSSTAADDSLEKAAETVRAIGLEALPLSSMRTSSALLAVTLIVGLAFNLAAVPEGVTATFREGVQAYDHGGFSTSQHFFARVVARSPRAVDAWANLGTASWARGDSAGAIRSWQLALLLDPLDGESRDRLNAVQPPSIRSPGYVPPVPPNLVAGVALTLWLGAWLVLAIPPARRPAGVRAVAGGAMVLTVVLLVATVEIGSRLDPRGLAVLRDARLLLEAPASTTSLASGALGEVVRVGAREGAWIHVALDGSRGGWVPVASVLLLDASGFDD